MDNLEKKLLDLQNENVEVPENVLNKINIAFDEIRNDTEEKVNKKRNKHINNKYIKAAAGLIIATTIIGFSTPVMAGINKLIFSFNNPGIENAVENNYIQNISDTEISTPDFNMELSNVLMDNSHIALDFKVKLKDSSKLLKRDLEDADVYSNIAIYDEKGNVIHKNGESGAIGALEYILDYTDMNKNVIGVKVLLTSSDATIPSTRKLNINVENLIFRSSSTEKSISSTDLNWNISVDIDKKLTTPSTIDYSFNSDSPNIVVNKATALPTGMFLDLDYLPTGHEENLLLNMKLIDEQGKEYNINTAKMEGVDNGGNNISGIFEGLTSFDNPDKFTLEIKNPDGVTIDRVHFSKK